MKSETYIPIQGGGMIMGLDPLFTIMKTLSKACKTDWQLTKPARVVLSSTLLFLVCLAGLISPAVLPASDNAAAESASSRFTDSDGWLDISGFLDTAYGFVPVAAPITEPAVGYGAVGALVFIDRKPVEQGQRYARPNIAAIGGLATENGTRGAFGAHMGTWLDGRLRTQIGVADMDVNLEYFGLGGGRNPGDTGFEYGIAARGGMVGGAYRFGQTPLWFGLNYAYADTQVSFDVANSGLDGIDPDDFSLDLAALRPSLTFDMRDNFFTPTQGWYIDLSAKLYSEKLGSDRDFETLSLNAMYYTPLSSTLFFSVRGGGKTSSDHTPFYLRPFVWLRGVQMLSYQGDQVAETEAELRWQFHPRFSLVGFGGAGIARSENRSGDRDKSVTAGGGGFRYLLARKHGLHMGIDVAFGPDEPIFYIVFGSAWLRP